MTQIVSSISSLEIYAPSAGSATYAKCDTNGRALTKLVESADVSAYQVVSATGAQLYAGTSYLTSVNTAPVSASRAGNAANASLANSAWYDGTGRLISSLPDSATVSAIASGYASSKADASSLSSYALSADVSSTIDTVSSNSASWGQGGVDSATVSSIASSYAESAVSSVESTVSANSASWGGGGDITFDSSFTGSGTVESPVGLSGALILACPNNTAQQIRINTGYAAGIAIKATRSSYLGSDGLTASAGSLTNRTSVECANWGIRFQSGAYNRTAIIDYPAVTSYSSKSANWDDVYTTVSSNSATWGGGGGASLPITGSAGAETATYDVTSVSFVRNDTAGEPDIRTATLSPDQFQINYTYNEQDYTSMTLTESTLDFEDADGAHVVDAYSIDSWNSAVDTVANNSATWGQGGDTYWSATEDSAFVGGFGSNLYGSGSAVCIGYDTTAKNTAVAIGVYGNSAYNSAIAIGAKNSADYGGVAIGAGNQTRTDGVSIGRGNTAYGANNRIIGTDNSAKYNSEVFGTSNRADDGITIGGHNSASGGIAIGLRLKMSGHNGLAVGQYNARSSDTLFVIGDGTLDGRSDALYVDLSGGLSAKGKISANGVELGAGGPVTATASAAAKAFTSTGAAASSFTGISSVNGSALLVSNMLPNAQQAAGSAHFHFMPTQSPWGSTEYTGLLSPLQYATGAALAMKQSDQYGAYYKGNEWFLSDVGTNTAANGVVRAELHRTRGIHLYGSSLDSSRGFHLHGSGIDGKYDGSAWLYGPTEYSMLTSVNDTVSNNSATWGQGGGIDSADCSAIASSYANDVSAAVSGTVDTVSSQSANWGGSALALSAGPGVSLTKSGNTLIAGLDETVLWSGANQVGNGSTEIAINDKAWNYEYVDIYVCPNYNTYSTRMGDQITRITIKPQVAGLELLTYAKTERIEANTYYSELFYVRLNENKFILGPGIKWQGTAITSGVTNYVGALTKIVGVNKTAEA